jgi:hypothetical protein
MTITVAEFLEEFAEFDPGDSSTDALVQAKLNAAYLRTPADIWGDLVDEGAKYLAAHLIATSPFARDLKLVQKTGETSYGVERAKLEGIVACGPRIAGDTSSWSG